MLYSLLLNIFTLIIICSTSYLNIHFFSFFNMYITAYKRSSANKEMYHEIITHMNINQLYMYYLNSYRIYSANEIWRSFSSSHSKCSKTYNQRTNGPVNAHLISWPTKAQNLGNIW